MKEFTTHGINEALHGGMPFHSGLSHVQVSPSSIRGLAKAPIRWFQTLKGVTCPRYIHQMEGVKCYNNGTEWSQGKNLGHMLSDIGVAIMRETHTWVY